MESSKERFRRTEKEANDKQWYKDRITHITNMSFSNMHSTNVNDPKFTNKYQRYKINYDLFNNKINMADFNHICSPFGDTVGKLPVDFTNKDIISGKIKALIGMELKRPSSWKVLAINKEATSRKEQYEADKIREYVINSIQEPIRIKTEKQYQSQLQNKDLTKEEQERIEQQIKEELKAKTPAEVKKYMQRDHQDPAEIQSSQLLELTSEREDVKRKFNKIWKHGLISGAMIGWIGPSNGHPKFKVVNPMYFDCEMNEDNDFIEQSDWACYKMYMTLSQISTYFYGQLTYKEIDDIYKSYTDPQGQLGFEFNNGTFTPTGVPVIHVEFKALKPVNFLSGVDLQTGEPYDDIVDEEYKLNKEVGDIKIVTEWIPTCYEGYQIAGEYYAFLREVPGQNKDLNNLHVCNLSYKGAFFDNMNSESVSIVDRMRYYQYMYNIIWYRVELLMASDEGKAFLLNSNLIPKKAGLTIEKWMYYFKVNKIGLMDPSQEGSKGNPNMGEAAKEIDMSLISDIQKYQMLAEYFEKRCGDSVGITKQIEGQIQANEAVRNTQVAVSNSANILEPYFDLHNTVKKNILQALVECAKTTYCESQPETLTYALDDMSIMMLRPDYDLLENSTLALYISNSSKTSQIMDSIQQLSHAAMQNQTIEMSDVISILNSESTQEAEEILKKGEMERQEREQANQESQMKAKADSEEKAREFRREEWKHDTDIMERQEELKTEREIQKQTILSLGFNEEKDLDRDGMPDVMEVAKFGVEANIKRTKIELEQDKFNYKKTQDAENLKIQEEKNSIARAKVNNSKKTS